MVLHLLAHELAKRGIDSFVTDTPNPAWQTKFADEVERSRLLALPDTVVVYPEIISGNPFNARHVVRWILNTPGVIGGDGIYSENDLVFLYQPYFTVKQHHLIRGSMQLFTDDLGVYYDQGLPRKGQGVIFHKGRHKPRIHHNPDALVLDGVNRSALPTVLNSLHTVVSYDHVTYLSLLAALAGCVSIVVPDGISTKDEWREKIPCFKYGIAYGTNDIEYALETRHLVRGHIEHLAHCNSSNISTFIDICRKAVR